MLFAESRTPEEFQAEVEAWLTEARPAVRDEMLREAMIAGAARLRVMAKNTGPRQLSHVVVRVSFPVTAHAMFEGRWPSSRFPDPPEAWGDHPRFGGLGEGFVMGVSTERGYVGDIRRGSDSLVVEFAPLTLPPGDEDQAGSIVLGIPASKDSALMVESRVTAKEAEDWAEDRHPLVISGAPLSPDALAMAIEKL